MRRTLGTLLLLLALGHAKAQNPSKIPASTSDVECGADGCADQPSAQTAGAAPVVIRSMGTAAGTNAKAIAASNPVAPAPPSNDFQNFVRDSLGHDLPVFGSSLFNSGGSAFAPSSGVVPAADYILGTGDQVLIRAWGKVDIDVRATVDRNGEIFIPRIGTLTVAGLRLDRLTDFIHNAIAQQFTGFQLSVSLGTLRSIQIFVLGHARAPGVYTISSLSTLINALFSSGGPSSTGTLRDVQLKREGQVISHFDVYKLLLSGDKSADMRLLPGDVIFVPPLGPQVAVDGNVGTPAIYELKPGETVGTVITEAGGLTPIAGTARAVLEHVVDHSRRSVEELSLNTQGLSIPLQAADILRIFPLSPKISDAVIIRGNVAQPGRYAWHAGMRVSDLIPNREFLLTRAYYNNQNALDTSTGSSFTAVPGTNSPVTATHDTEINWNYAVIQRLDSGDLTDRLIPFALGEAIANPASPENKQLNAGDVVVIYSRNDIALPLELQAKFVRIDGQVKAPGVYRVGVDETLRDLVTRAGGLVPHAYLFASLLTRDSVKADQQARLQVLIARESQAVLAPSNQRSSIGGATNDLELRKAYLAELAKIQPDGRVVLRIPPNARSIEDVPTLPLEDGDHYYVPNIPNTVDVLGAVYNTAALSYTPNARSELYLNESGGATREADRKREFILRANGMLVSRQNVGNFNRLTLYPGDALIVPPKLKAPLSAADFANLTSALSAFAVSAVAIEAIR